jgi:transcriptional regulator with XRE-family HTH domain
MSTTPEARGQTVSVFRSRLAELVERSGLSASRFASRAGIDRSTLSLLLSPANSRLPRAESIAHIAASSGASVDWLLGLSQDNEIRADIVAAPVISENADDPANEQILRWLEEARGAKIRYVPSSIPDHLRTAALIAYESGKQEGGKALAAIMRARVAHARSAVSEIEVCSPVQSLEHLARGQGIWQRLGLPERRRQLEQMCDLAEELYPAYRWFLFDGRKHFAAPYTVYGHKRAAVYMGEMYFVFTSTAHVRELTKHFDNLIRHAVVQPNAVAPLVRKLLKDIS